MKRVIALGGLLALALSLGQVWAAEAIESGPQVGNDIPGPFKPLNVTEPPLKPLVTVRLLFRTIGPLSQSPGGTRTSAGRGPMSAAMGARRSTSKPNTFAAVWPSRSRA